MLRQLPLKDSHLSSNRANGCPEGDQLLRRSLSLRRRRLLPQAPNLVAGQAGGFASLARDANQRSLNPSWPPFIPRNISSGPDQVGGRISIHLQEWQHITTDPFIVNIRNGYSLAFNEGEGPPGLSHVSLNFGVPRDPRQEAKSDFRDSEASRERRGRNSSRPCFTGLLHLALSRGKKGWQLACSQ